METRRFVTKTKINNMESPNLGPQWVWGCFGFLTVLGAVAVLVGIIAGIVWCFNHISIS